MDRFGDEGAGFSVEFDAAAGAVSVRAWGFWGADVAKAFGPAVRDACLNKPAGTLVRMDMTALKPMREEGQLSFGSIVSQLPQLGIGQLRIQTASQLTKLQLVRIASEHGKMQFVQVD
jgi:hypothetical protein